MSITNSNKQISSDWIDWGGMLNVTADCDDNKVCEPCPEPIGVTIDGCQDSLAVDLGNTFLESTGRILQISATVKNVCPGKRVALGIVLTEVDEEGIEHPRGMKTITIPAHNHSTCRDVVVSCVKFVLPEDLNVSGGIPGAMCSARNLRVRLISHHIDSTFVCCDPAIVCPL
jgi:Ca-activated chloride channel family protein